MISPPRTVFSRISWQSSGLTWMYIMPMGSMWTRGPISQKPWQPLILTCRLFSSSVSCLRPMYTGRFRLSHSAGDAAGTGADQHGGGLLAAAQGPLGLVAQVAERVAGQLHWAASSFRIFSSSSRALVGDILAWTSPSTVITGARPQAPRQATVSRVNMPSSLVLRLPDRPRYS